MTQIDFRPSKRRREVEEEKSGEEKEVMENDENPAENDVVEERGRERSESVGSRAANERSRSRKAVKDFLIPEQTQAIGTGIFQIRIESLYQEAWKNAGQRRAIYSRSLGGVFGFTWYAGARDRTVPFFSKTPEERRDALKWNQADGSAHSNLYYSKEWEEVRPVQEAPNEYGGTCGLVAIISNNSSTNRDKNSKVYTICRTWDDVESLYERLGLANCNMEEMILGDMPHKMFFDIERDLVNDGNTLQWMDGVFKTKFLKHLYRFFKYELKLDIRKDDLLVTYASKEGKKFSAHVVLHSETKGYYAQSKDHSKTVWLRLDKYLRGVCEQDDEFKRWYIYRSKGAEATMVDHNVYGSTQRNMRLVLCCKRSSVSEQMRWTDLRPLVPPKRSQDRPLSDFFVSLFDAWNNPHLYTPINIPGTDIDWASHALTQKNTTTIVQGRRVEGNGSPWYTNLASTANLELMEKVVSQVQEKPSEWNHLKQYAKKLLQDVVTKLHPKASGVLRVDESRGEGHWIFSTHTHPTAPHPQPGKTGTPRLCYFGCNKGNNRVHIVTMYDLSVMYKCYGCNRTDVIIASPVRPDLFAPLADQRHAMSKLHERYLVRYDVFEDTGAVGQVDMRKTMKELKTHEEWAQATGSPAPERITYIEQGAMGTGKTHAVGHLAEKVVREKEGVNPRDDGPKAKILVVTFRIMLAVNIQKTLKSRNNIHCELYSDLKTEREENEIQDFYDVDKLIIQMDSIRNIRRRRDGESNEYDVPVYDIVFIDELASVLQHFSGGTVTDKLCAVWHVLKLVCRKARILVCADAEIGEREMQFIAMCRKTGEDASGKWIFDGLEYHLNRNVVIKTFFKEYHGEFEWVNKMVHLLVAGENLFVCSNSLKKIGEIHAYVKGRIAEIIRTRYETLKTAGWDDEKIALDKTCCRLLHLLGASKEITSETPNTERKLLAEDMERWKDFHILIISPTVGAGVDFSEDHFDQVFVYASQGSCTPRALDQMRGRVRRVRKMTCHVYLQPLKNDSMDEPTLETCLAEIKKLDRFTTYEESSENSIVQRNTVDENLILILAYNLLEKRLAEWDFGRAWRGLQQQTDPNLSYEFFDSSNWHENCKYMIQYESACRQEQRKNALQCAGQRILSPAEFYELEQKDMYAATIEGSGCHSFKEYALLKEKNEIVRFFGLDSCVDPETFAQIGRLGLKKKRREQIDAFLRVIFSSEEDLKKMCNSVRDGGGYFLFSEDFRETVGIGTVQGLYPDFLRVRKLLDLLLQASGGSLEHLHPKPEMAYPHTQGQGQGAEDNEGSPVYRDIDLKKAFEVHSGVAHQQRKDDEFVNRFHDVVNHEEVRANLPFSNVKSDTDLLKRSRFFLEKLLYSKFGVKMHKHQGSCSITEHRQALNEDVGETALDDESGKRRKNKACCIYDIDEGEGLLDLMELCLARSFSSDILDQAVEREIHVQNVDRLVANMHAAERLQKIQEACKACFKNLVKIKVKEEDRGLLRFKILPYIFRSNEVVTFFNEMRWQCISVEEAQLQCPAPKLPHVFSRHLPDFEKGEKPPPHVSRAVKLRRGGWNEMRQEMFEETDGISQLQMVTERLDRRVQTSLQEAEENMKRVIEEDKARY